MPDTPKDPKDVKPWWLRPAGEDDAEPESVPEDEPDREAAAENEPVRKTAPEDKPEPETAPADKPERETAAEDEPDRKAAAEDEPEPETTEPDGEPDEREPQPGEPRRGRKVREHRPEEEAQRQRQDAARRQREERERKERERQDRKQEDRKRQDSGRQREDEKPRRQDDDGKRQRSGRQSDDGNGRRSGKAADGGAGRGREERKERKEPEARPERDRDDGDEKAEETRSPSRRRRGRGRRGGSGGSGGNGSDAGAAATAERQGAEDGPRRGRAAAAGAEEPSPDREEAPEDEFYFAGDSATERKREVNDERTIALFCDLENIALGVRDSSEVKKFDINLVIERLLEKGKLIVKKAYCDWGRYSDFKRPFHEAAIEMIDIPQKYVSGKNSADIKMVVDAMDLCYSKEHVDTFAILSGDSDFSPLVSKLKENNKYVIGVGVKGSSSNLLIDNCDEFIYYEDVWRSQRRGPQLEDLPKKSAEVFSLMITAIQALVRENKEILWGSMIKQTMQRKKPSFNEGYYGYGSFSELLQDAEKRSIIKLKKDQRSGSYIVTGFAKERR